MEMSASVAVVIVLLLAISIDAAPKPNYGSLSRYNNNEDVDMYLIERKPLRSFDVLKIGGGFGVAKRYENGEKRRRGPLNGLIPGGAFGRASRNANQKYYSLVPGGGRHDAFPLNLEKIRKFVNALEESRIDGQPLSKLAPAIERNSQEFDTSNHVDCE